MSMDSTFSLPSVARRSSLDKATNVYAESVVLAQPYLTTRGFDERVAEQWRFGYVLDPLPGHERFKNRLVIPYLTHAGAVHLKFRCIQDHECDGHGKYDAEEGTTTRLFGAMSFWQDSSFICITEGELDAVTLSICGLPAVAIPGVNTWKRHMPYAFEGYEEVIVITDGDEYGRKLASRVSADLYTSCRSITLPSGEDVNSIYVKDGADALRERVGIDG